MCIRDSSNSLAGTKPCTFNVVTKKVGTQYASFPLKVNFSKGEIEFEVSPTKFLKGHNICGSNRLHVLLEGVLEQIYHRFQTAFTSRDRLFYRRNGVELLRVDMTGGFLVKSQAEVVETMALIEKHLLDSLFDIVVHKSYKGTGTIYLGKNSSRSTIKFYNKYLEVLARNKKLALLPYYQALISYAERLIRYELTLRSSELKRLKLNNSNLFSIQIFHQMLLDHLTKLNFASGPLVTELTGEQVAGLKPEKRAKYQQWRDGIDLHRYFSPATISRLRTYLLQFDLDIAHTYAQTQDAVTLAQRLSLAKLRTTYPKGFVDLGAVYC